MDKEEFGRRIAAKRVEIGMSRQELAAGAGIALSTLGPYERGEKLPSVDTALALANKLGVSLDWLCTGEEIEANKEQRLNTWGDVIRAIGVITADVDAVRIESVDKYYIYRKDEYEREYTVQVDEGKDFDFSITDYRLSFPSSDPGEECLPLEKIWKSWASFLSLYADKQVDREMYMAWIEKKAREHDKDELPPVLPF